MIRVTIGQLADEQAEGVIRPIRSDLAPVTPAAREIDRRGGEELEARLSQIGPLPVGGAVLTPAGPIAADFLIHVVVASPEEPQTALSVQKALKNGLRRAVDWGLESVALPPLGLGVGALDPEASARALVEILVNHLGEGAAPLDLTIVAGSEYEAGLLQRLVEELAGD